MQSLPQAFNLQVLRHKCISCHAVQAALAMEAGNDWIFDGLLVLLEQLVLMPIVVVDREGHSPSPPGQKLAPELVVDTANLLQKGCLAIPSVLDALLTIERPANTALQVRQLYINNQDCNVPTALLPIKLDRLAVASNCS
jgi:hypothetical protein